MIRKIQLRGQLVQTECSALARSSTLPLYFTLAIYQLAVCNFLIVLIFDFIMSVFAPPYPKHPSASKSSLKNLLPWFQNINVYWPCQSNDIDTYRTTYCLTFGNTIYEYIYSLNHISISTLWMFSYKCTHKLINDIPISLIWPIFHFSLATIALVSPYSTDKNISTSVVICPTLVTITGS